MRLSRWIALAAVLVAGAGGASYWLWVDLHTAALLPPGGALISVAPGEPFGVTAARLQAAGIVRHGWVLRLWTRRYGLDRVIRSGEYRFEQALSPLEVLAVLRSPMASLHRVTIPEGSTLNQVAGLLATAGFGGADQFLCLASDPEFLQRLDLPARGLEGYLFPDTYAFAWSTPADQILTAMVERFRAQVASLRAQRIEAGISEPDMVILGSLIEKETGTAAERPLVSAVFHNRLRIRMPLQSDPTAMYGRDGSGPPTAADLSVDSPYNTYLHHGLPPGPICNPGRSALQEALTPAHVPYLYFVSRNDGTHAFSRTLEEHNHAVARFQRGRDHDAP